jgi:hypothetical protein
MDDLEALKRKLTARENRSGFNSNVEALKQRIAEMEAQNGG